jgi:TRAP-type uncharacterized transport system fused permease subunit
VPIPTRIDQVFGALAIVLVLEATRRTTGAILPAVAIGFLAYAVFGAYLPAPWTHQGYGIDRLVGHMYLTLEGIFGVPLDVAATFIILFTIYGAVLEYSKGRSVSTSTFLWPLQAGSRQRLGAR